MNAELITAVAIGIGLAASAGFRVFEPMLVAAVAAKAGVLPLNESFQWLSSWTSIAILGTATIVEIMAYYIPVIDNLLDTIATPLAVVAGTLLLTSVLPIESELMKWITGAAVGGGSAAVVQSGSALTRLTSTKLTAGIGNPVVATVENVAATGTSILSLVIPFFILAIFLLLVILVFISLRRKLRRKRIEQSEEPRP
jgi:large-conductance mechanosensitive channel